MIGWLFLAALFIIAVWFIVLDYLEDKRLKERQKHRMPRTELRTLVDELHRKFCDMRCHHPGQLVFKDPDGTPWC